MKLLKGLGLGIAALTLAGGVTRAAVMTSTVRVTSGQPPYSISYILAQDMQFGEGTMKVNIRRASDNVIVRTINVDDDMALSPGAHANGVVWDGKITGGATAPSGSYYAEIVTTGNPLPAMTLLAGPSQTRDAAGAAIDGRNDYGGEANRNPNSPYHNLHYLATRASNASARTGVWVANADTSHNAFFKPAADSTWDYISGAVLQDDHIVLTGQTSGNVTVVAPDGTTAAIYGGGRILTRTVKAFGTVDHPELFYIGGGGINGTDIRYIKDLSAFGSSDTPLMLAASGDFPGPVRGIVVNQARTAFWVSGALGTSAPYAFVYKYNIVRDGTGNITGATRDTGFTYTDPAAYPTAANQRWLALSPDESILWFSINEGSAPFANNNALVVGYNSSTGADLGASYRYVAQFNPETISVTTSGNLYVATYPGTLTGSTSRSIYLLAPPDAGSTDTTRSPDFLVTTNTNNTVTAGPTVSNLSYHGATIQWTTAFPGDTKLSYGTTTAYGSDVSVAGEPDVEHSVTLNTLAPGTTYLYKVTTSLPGLSDATATGQFTTNPLVISNIQVPQAQLSAGSATITWTTSEPSTSWVRFGEFSETYGDPVGNNTLTTEHSVTLTNLPTGTDVFYVVESGWPGAPAVRSAEGTFTTPTYNLITSESLSATATSATMTFKTLAPAAATVKFGTAPDALGNTATVSGGGSTTLSAAFNGLSAGTTYYYSLTLTNGSIGAAGVITGTFTTPVAGGTAKTVTHNTLADLSGSVSHNVALGGSGALLRLDRQGVPGAPVAGPDLPMGNYYSGVTVANGYMYVVGGANASATPVNTVYYIPLNADGTLDAVAGWKTTTPLPEPRIMLNDQVFAYNNYLYAIGGSANSSTHLNTVLYAKINADGTVGAWQTGRPLPAARSFAGIIPVNGRVLVNGGFDVADRNTNYSAEIRPDGSLGPWLTITTLDTTRNFHRAVTSGEYVYSVSRFAGQSVAGAPTTPTSQLGTFRNLNVDLPTLQYAMAAGLLRGKIVAAAGRTTDNVPLNPASIQTSKILPDGSLAAWQTAATPYPVAVADVDGAAYNGRLYVAGGRTVFSGSTPTPTPAAVVIPMVDDPADPGYATFGQLESGVIDLGALGSLQRITVSGSGLSNDSVEVRYRFAATAGGNGAPVFTDWLTASGPDAAISGGARYVQYQVNLKGNGSATPTVTGVSLIANVAGVTNLPGDVNKNGIPYEAEDVRLALKIAAGLLSASDPSVSFENANVAGGSTVDMADAVLIARRHNGL